MAELLEEINVAENEIIFEEGDLGDSLYIVVTGKVKVHNGEVTLNYLEAGQIFGEMALLDAETRSASITAVEPNLLLKLDQDHLAHVKNKCKCGKL
jgi:CRP-like cAMP-binding protein